MARLAGRLSIAAAVLRRAPLRRAQSTWPADPQRILVVHRLLLGDTLMLTPLLKKLRTQHPRASITLTLPRAFMPLFAGAPYGVQTLPFDPHDAGTIRGLLASGPFDAGIVPGDNRHSWLALAAGCRHIVAHADDRPAWKNWPLDRAVPFTQTPATWGEMLCDLLPGPAPAAFDAAEWPAPIAQLPALPSGPYAVLHVGAGNPLRSWFANRWRALAAALAARGLTVIWSAGASEMEIVRAADPEGRHLSVAGQLDLAQLWHALRGAQLLVCPDTGIAHLARTAGARSLVLYGQGSEVLFGTGAFWKQVPQVALTEAEFPCRDQQRLFRREIHWVRRCDRRAPACKLARCMEPLTVERVLDAAQARGWLG